MFDDLAAYYHENVVSAYVDHRDIKRSGIAGRSRDIRSATIAAEALFHLREHLSAHKPSRATIERQCPEYGLLADIANATKHKQISRQTPHGPPLVNDAEQIKEQIVLTEYKDADGEYHFTEKTVVVTLSDGSTRDLFEVLTVVINYWENFLFSQGILTTARTFLDGSNAHPKTREECKQSQLDIEIIQGHRFHQAWKLQRFNYQTQKVEPVDLTGSQVKFNVYKPSYEIDLSLTHDASGKEFKKTIALCEEENEILLKCKTDEERQTYVQSLSSAQEAMRQLAKKAGLVKETAGNQEIESKK
jgi:hypothetical protein